MNSRLLTHKDDNEVYPMAALGLDTVLAVGQVYFFQLGPYGLIQDFGFLKMIFNFSKGRL